MSAIVYEGSCLDVMQLLDDNSVDAIVTDPPYHLTSIVKRFGSKNAAPAKSKETGAFARASRGFMGQTWDGGDIAFRPETWEEALRVLKPGGHIAAFSGTRTYHRMAVAIEDAGFEIRDQLAWTYGSGFPKSHDVSKAITKRADPVKVREIKLWLADQFDRSGKSRAQINREAGFTASDYLKTEPGNDAGGRATWHLLLPYGEKWGRLREVLGFDARYDAEIEQFGVIAAQRSQPKATKDIYGTFSGVVTDFSLTEAAAAWQGWGSALKPAWEPICLARKPLDGTIAENVLAHGVGALNIDGCRVPSGPDVNDRASKQGLRSPGYEGDFGLSERSHDSSNGRFPANIVHDGEAGFGEQGRFFYCAKASKSDRGEGNNHPTVKPTELMRWLCRLITPPGGRVLDPFTGSGSTGRGAVLEGFRFVGIELSAEYAAIARRRIAAVQPAPISLEDMLA